MNPQTAYSEEFFRRRSDKVRQSAREVIPLLRELVEVRSVVDVGCGTGTWLSVFQEHGIKDVAGLDGNWVQEKQLEIPVKCFRRHDLEKPLRLERRFDLAVSLEVAEHLPPTCASAHVQALTELAPLILFSAAIPFQGGTNHLNEQWAEYWEQLFAEQGYEVIDVLRREIWQNERVQFFYAQNIFLYATPEHIAQHQRLQQAKQATDRRQLSLVHPRQLSYLGWMHQAELACLEMAAKIPAGERFILVDEHHLAEKLTEDQRASAILFVERDGTDWGAPPDDATAVQEWERLRREGINWIVFAMAAFWWLDRYPGLRRAIETESSSVSRTDNAIIFQLPSRS